jgi:Peroxisome biogenesis factor 1, N-terminal
MPLTTQDWEFMELYAHCFEDGAMLRQWTVLFPNQILSLYPGGADTSSTRPYQSLKVSLCVIVDPVSTNVQRCFRWVSDTEVIVVPKPRNTSASSTTITSPPCRLLGTQDDWSAGMMNLASVMDISVLSVAPATMKVHPLTLEPFWEKSSPESLLGRNSGMAKVWKYSSQTGKIVTVALVQIELCTDIEVNTVGK